VSRSKRDRTPAQTAADATREDVGSDLAADRRKRRDDSTVPVNAPHQRAPGDDELPPGARAGEYLIEGPIAAGGCGTVYSAQHRTRGGRAAVKVLHRYLAFSPEMVERFFREAQAIQRIDHPNVVDVLEAGELQDGRPFLVMELLDGKSLAALLQQRGRLSPPEALAYLAPVVGALDAAHAAGIVHRDVKGSNVLVLREGDAPDVKLLDFGIAKLTQPDPLRRSLTAVGQRIGTPSAMAPEQIRGVAVDARADVYSLGVLLFQLLTGRTPFVADDATEMERLHLEVPPPRPSSLAPVSPELDAVVLRCLEKAPERRYATAGAFLEALRAAVAPSTAAGPERAATGAAFYVEVALGADDDLLLAHMADVLDGLERELANAGFRLHVQTGAALLAVRLLPQDASAALDQRRSFLELGAALARARPGTDPRLQVSVQLHAGPVLVRESPDGPSFSGPLLQIESWVAEAAPGFRATDAALASDSGAPPRTGAP
jgi:serine/threonine-protein kinase